MLFELHHFLSFKIVHNNAKIYSIMRTLLVTFTLLTQFTVTTFAQENLTTVDKSLDDIISESIAKSDSIFQEIMKKPFPGFTSISLAGDTISEKDLLGKVTFMDFWFTHCSPCIAAFDDLENLYKKWRNNPKFQFISFCTDPLSLATESAQKYKLPYPVYPIKREQFSTILIKGFPLILIINQEGKIIHYKAGGSIEKKKIAKEIQDIEKIIKNTLSKGNL